MTANPSTPLRRDAGFTLIEVLATLLLTGLLVSSMTIITGQWLGGWNRGAARMERAEQLTVALDRLAMDIQSAIALPTVGQEASPSFIGAVGSMMFIHPPFDHGASTGLEIVSLFSSSDGILMRARAGYDSRVSLEKSLVGEAVAVSREPFGIAFAYLNNEGKWESEWREARPPSAVRTIFKAQRGSGHADVVSSFAIHASAPAICARAKSFSACDALAAGKSTGIPDDAAAARRARARAGVEQ